MARSGGGMIGLAGVGISVLALAIVFMLAPTKRDKVLKEEKGFFRALNRRKHGLCNACTPGDKMREDSSSVCRSAWNASYNTALTSGADIWQTLSPFLIPACGFDCDPAEMVQTVTSCRRSVNT